MFTPNIQEFSLQVSNPYMTGSETHPFRAWTWKFINPHYSLRRCNTEFWTNGICPCCNLWHYRIHLVVFEQNELYLLRQAIEQCDRVWVSVEILSLHDPIYVFSLIFFWVHNVIGELVNGEKHGIKIPQVSNSFPHSLVSLFFWW